jgi:hypothetical protein
MVIDYCGLAVDYLGLAFDRGQALFSYASRLDERGRLVNDFRRPDSYRYTINTYLGLAEAQRHGRRIDWLRSVEDGVHEFLALHENELQSWADRGLLLVLLAATARSHPAGERSLERIERALSNGKILRQLNMQDLAWLLWGASHWVDDGRTRVVADRLFEIIRSSYVHPRSGLPRHSVARYRDHIVSFGSVVYFLRALHEYAEACDSDEARRAFGVALRRVLAIQGRDGAWPWMIDVRSGSPFDLYPIFTVHQDSMAMLFLFVAESCGIPGATEAIERSLRWNFGSNELGIRMVTTEPYPWIYRSIERDERWPRARRYLRGLGSPPSAPPTRRPRLRINRECRSYHLGWVLYNWSSPVRYSRLEALCSGV